MYTLVQQLLFLLPPERAHYFTMALLKIPLLRMFFRYRPEPRDQFHFLGLDFPARVGLAAGFDKDGRWIDPLADLGFGFIEVGTVTPKPQPGNEKPRLFRLKKDQALINRMGFNNQGVDALAVKLQQRKNKSVIIGGNIGKNKITPNENALDDYLICFEKLYPWVDYFVVNVSSPNTPGLRELQEKGPLKKILHGLMEANRRKPNLKPVLLKIAPDLTENQLDDIIEIVQETGISGIVATNTTIERKGLSYPEQEIRSIGAGGLSGKPVRQKSTEVIRYISTKSTIPIMGAGGIITASDAEEKIHAGASLVQLYTGFIYSGPGLVRRIIEHLRK